jgi:PPP family 3-phenylpropionic acid transporter
MLPGRPWAFWMLFFFQYAAIAVYFTYLNVYFRGVGLSGTEIGWINMASALVGVASAVLWGSLADRTGRPRFLIAAGAVGALLVTQLIPMVDGFGVYLLLSVLGGVFNAAPMTLADSTTLAWLGDRREDYGRYRLGGSVGYILVGMGIGFVFDWLGLRWMFPLYGVLMLAFAAVALFLPDLPVRSEARAPGAVGAMMRRPAWIVLILSIFLIWIASYATITFLGVVLDAQGGSQALIGIASTVGAVIEVPFMMFSPLLLRKFGPARLMVIAIALQVLRFLLLAWLPSPEWAIPFNALNGPAFVLWWNSALTLSNRMAPPGLAGTAQGLIASTMSLGGVVSALLAGVLFDRLGPAGLFLVMALCTFTALVLFSAGNMRAFQKEAAPSLKA